jgi:homoserine kinase type II
MLPMGLSMLWESTDPPSALRDRFGLDSFDEGVRWLTKVLAEAWAIDVQGCGRIVLSDANAIAWVDTDRGALVVKWSRAQEQFDRFAATADLTHALYERGVPVAPPLPAVDGRRRVIVASASLPLSMTVLPMIEGELLDTTDATAVRAAGAHLANLHRVMAAQVDARLIDSARTPALDLRQRIVEWLEQQDPGRAPAASARLREQVSSLRPIDAEPQLIHNDYRASNILTMDSEVVGIVDFDEIAWDYCVADIANASVLLATLFRNWAPTSADVRKVFLEGYQSVRRLTSLEREWLEVLVLCRSIQAIPAGDDPTGWADAV